MRSFIWTNYNHIVACDALFELTFYWKTFVNVVAPIETGKGNCSPSFWEKVSKIVTNIYIYIYIYIYILKFCPNLVENSGVCSPEFSVLIQPCTWKRANYVGIIKCSKFIVCHLKLFGRNGFQSSATKAATSSAESFD